MKISIAVRTVPQRREMFEQMRQQLFDGMTPALAGFHVSDNADITPNENACRALGDAWNDISGWVLFLEDDAGLPLHFMRNVEYWLTRHQRSDVHVYPLGAQYAHVFPQNAQVWEYPLNLFYCSVALVIRTSMVPSLLCYVRAQPARQGLDIFIGRWHQTVSESPCLLTPVPSLVEHLGDESTLVEHRAEKNQVGRFAGFGGWDFSFERRHG